MKTAIFLLGISLLFCSSENEPSDLSPQQKAVIKTELSAIVNQVIESSEKLDAEAASLPYLNSPEFLAINTDASIVDHAGFTKANAEFYKTLSSLKFTTVKLDYRFLTNSLVLCTWVGIAETVLKSGERFKIAPYVATVLFRHDNNQWKIIYSQETSATPTEEKETK